MGLSDFPQGKTGGFALFSIVTKQIPSVNRGEKVFHKSNLVEMFEKWRK